MLEGNFSAEAYMAWKPEMIYLLPQLQALNMFKCSSTQDLARMLFVAKAADLMRKVCGSILQ